MNSFRSPFIALLIAFFSTLLIGGCIALLMMGCGHASDVARAVEIRSPVGVTCFAIQDDTGKTVGGNCLWSR